MQMFFTVNSRSDLRGESEDESGESEECFPEVEKRTEIFFFTRAAAAAAEVVEVVHHLNSN